MKKEFVSILLLFLLVTIFFFYPVVKGFVPFPGDLLVSNFGPYSSQSYFGYGPGGVPNKAQGSDVIKEAFPWKTFVIDQLKKGQIPFWSPYNFAGNPIMANFQSAVFYPGNLLFFILPFIASWTAFIVLAPLLAGFFTYLFLREIQTSKVAGIFGGIVFAFSSYMVVWMEYGNITHTYLWLPLALLMTEKLTKTFTKKNLFVLLLILLLSLSAGYIQGYFYIVMTVLLYFFVKHTGRTKIDLKRSCLFLFIVISPFFLFLFQLLPTLSLFQHSSRSGYSLKQIQELLNPVWYTITTIIPNFFGHPASRNHWFNGTYIERVSYFGLIPFILATAALFAEKKKKEIFVFSSIFIITFFLATDFFINKFFYLLPIPVFSTTVPTRVLGLFVFAGSILSAIGLDYFSQKKFAKRFFVSWLIVFSLILGSFILVQTAKFFPHLSASDLAITKRNLVLPGILAGLFFVIFFLNFYSGKFFKKLKISKILLSGCLVVITVFDLFYFFHKITPFSPKEYIYPETPVVSYLQKEGGTNRFWGYGSAYIGSNFQAVDKTYSPEGEDPLHLRLYTELISATENGKVPSLLPRPDANIAPGYGVGNFEQNAYRQKFLNLVGVKYILNKNDGLGTEMIADHATFSGKNYNLIWQQTPWQIYENVNVAPRVFLTNDYLVIKDEKKVVEKLFSSDFNEKTTLILENDPKIQKAPLTSKKAKIVAYSPNTVKITTESNAPALLFFSDTFSVFWHATVDGKDVKVYKADYAFRTVAVPAGTHTVTFSYNSERFTTGLVYSGVFAIMLGLIFVFIKIKKT